jgi:CheY-like chemotaxis protein
MAGNRKVVLVVDDVSSDVDLIAHILRTHYQVKVATSGERALAIAHKQPPDLVTLDLIMPDMTGREVAMRLRGDPVTADIPIVFISAMADDHSLDEDLEQLAFAALNKPIDPDELLATVARALIG